MLEFLEHHFAKVVIVDCTPKLRHEIKGQFTLNGGEQCRCPDSNIPGN